MSQPPATVVAPAAARPPKLCRAPSCDAGIAASSVKLKQAFVEVIQSCNTGVTPAHRRRARPEISAETKLNSVDVLRVRPEGRFRAD